MTLGDFCELIPHYEYFAIKSLNHKWQRRTDNIFTDNYGLTSLGFAAREGFGNDWNLHKARVIKIEVYTSKDGTTMPCAVIE